MIKMNRQWIIVYLLVACTHLSHQRSTSNDLSYRAAVITYNSIYIPSNTESTLNHNCAEYIEYIEIAQMMDVDIIVFPEYGLTSINLLTIENIHNWTIEIPSPVDNYIPCTERNGKVDNILIKISCAAKENRIYVVINIAERMYSFEEKKSVYYSSNVVFDRTGRIIAKYRKMHLSGIESQFNVSVMEQDYAIFNTDFGVKFATFTSYDILFYEPALKWTRIEKITDIVHPTAWYSEMPFLTATQIEAGWSFSENVNLLTSSYNRPHVSNTGGGIYLGRKGIGQAVLPNSKNSLITYDVPKINRNEMKSWNLSTFYNYRDNTYNFTEQKIRLQNEDENKCKKQENVSEKYDIFLYHDYNSAFHLFDSDAFQTYICSSDNEFCCMFKGHIENVDPCITYHFIFLKKSRAILEVEGSVLTCSIIQCSGDSSKSCGSVEKTKTLFKNLQITAEFGNHKNLLIMPSTLNSNLFPLNNWTYSESVYDDNIMSVTISINETDDIVTFGLYLRNFSEDKLIRDYIKPDIN